MMRELVYSRASRVAASGFSLLFTLGIFVLFYNSASASASAERSPNPYPFGKSTYWAWQNRPDLPANLGEAKDWNDKAGAQGWPVGLYPRTGDIAVFEPGVLGADSVTGHVAFVRQVFD